MAASEPQGRGWQAFRLRQGVPYQPTAVCKVGEQRMTLPLRSIDLYLCPFIHPHISIYFMARRPDPKPRTIIISDYISKGSVSDAIKSILEINEDDSEKDEVVKDWERQPIQLVLNTYGGSVYDGLGLIGAMEVSQTPVHTYAIGSAMSMGLFILLMGQKRFSAPYSTLMYHQISTFAWDKLEGIKDQIKEAERLETMMEQMLYDRSQVKPETIETYKKERREWYIAPEEAKKLGIIDEILAPGEGVKGK
jgi:ATP-dependent Clp protease, protease subunit